MRNYMDLYKLVFLKSPKSWALLIFMKKNKLMKKVVSFDTKFHSFFFLSIVLLSSIRRFCRLLHHSTLYHIRKAFSRVKLRRNHEF